jgi:lauroyl/myristoyl acyltransferase
MNFQRLMNSQRAGVWAFRLARMLPPRAGFLVADFIADRLAASRTTPMIQAVRLNQWVVNGESLSSSELDQALRESMRSVTRSFFRLFHYMNDLPAINKLVVLDPRVEELIARSALKERGVMVVGLHLSGFDLVIRSAASRGIHATALSLPDPDAAVEWQHTFRSQGEFNIISANMANLRKVARRLQEGEVVVTGIDRPVPDIKLRPKFFGRPACLPTHHIHLALQCSAPILVMAPVWGEDGRCYVRCSEYLELQPNSDRQRAVLDNAEMVLDVAASFIRQAPRQWVIYQPVWPEVSAIIP